LSLDTAVAPDLVSPIIYRKWATGTSEGKQPEKFSFWARAV
jgi:hypothetical protein